MRAWTGELDGEPVAMGGVLRGQDGRWYVFFDVKPEGRKFKKTIMKSAKRFFEQLDVKYAYAIPDPKEKNALKWMTKLGFKPHDTMMRWENKDGH